MVVVPVSVLIVIGLVVAAFLLGRLVQWISDARDAIGSRRRPGRDSW